MLSARCLTGDVSVKKSVRLLLGLVVAFVGCRAQSIHRNYVETGELDSADEEVILRLVARIGITHVSEITTYYVHPTSYVAITVKEAELTENDIVRFRRVHITREGWWESALPREEQERFSEGAFTIDRVNEVELTVFRIDTGTYRIQVGPGIERSTAEWILTCIGGNSVRFETSANPDLQKYFELGRLERIVRTSVDSENNHTLALLFSISDYWWFNALIRVNGQELVVFETLETQT